MFEINLLCNWSFINIVQSLYSNLLSSYHLVPTCAASAHFNFSTRAFGFHCVSIHCFFYQAISDRYHFLYLVPIGEIHWQSVTSEKETVKTSVDTNIKPSMFFSSHLNGTYRSKGIEKVISKAVWNILSAKRVAEVDAKRWSSSVPRIWQ